MNQERISMAITYKGKESYIYINTPDTRRGGGGVSTFIYLFSISAHMC